MTVDEAPAESRDGFSYSQLTPNARCHPKFRNGQWGDLGKANTDEECQRSCSEEPKCKFVSRYQINKKCTSFYDCTMMQSVDQYSSWERVSEGMPPTPGPRPTHPTPLPGMCKTWCLKEHCSWKNCQGCSLCASAPESPPTTPRPTPEYASPAPTPLPGMCKPWCLLEHCSWKNCKGCSQCASTPQTSPSTPRPTPESASPASTDAPSTSPAPVVEGSEEGCLLPLGDSITQAYVGRVGYRYRLWKHMVDAGMNFEWIGSLTEHSENGLETIPNPPPLDELNPDYKGMTFPRQHEGHTGWRTDQILENMKGWLPTYTCEPTCVMLHLGSNDMMQGNSVSSTLNELDSLINILKDSGADPTILLAVPIPSCGLQYKPKTELGEQIAKMGDPSRKVHIVRMDEIGFSARHDAFDWCHPNDAGEEKMAAKWFEAVEHYCVA